MSDEELTEQEMTDLIAYDPFAPGEGADADADASANVSNDAAVSGGESGPPGEQGVPASVGGTSDNVAGGSDGGDTAPLTSPQATPGGDVRLLQQLVSEQAKTIQDLISKINDGRQVGKAGESNNDPMGQTPTAANLPAYDYEIPDALVEALSHDDAAVRRRGIQALVKGTAISVHQQIMATLEPKFQELQSSTISRMTEQQRVANQREAIKADFYGRYPQLSDPALAPFVASVTEKVMAETGLTSWSEQLRDAVGMRALQILGRAPAPNVQAPAQAQAQNVRPAVPAPPPAMRGSNNRPPMAGSGSVDEVYDLVFGR